MNDGTCIFADPGAFGALGLTFVNRLKARGVPVSFDASGFAVPERFYSAAKRAGLVERGGLGALASEIPVKRCPRIFLYTGPAVGYPYWGYYAHALLSVGLLFRCGGPAEILNGALDRADLLIMPGGFATWGLDRAEVREGLDSAVRSFLARGGAYLGSCGGAFYTAQGRPGWLGLFDTVPLFTQEYLSTGAGLVSIQLSQSPLSCGMPPALEMPYYHGPVFDEPRQSGHVAGRYRSLVAPTQLFIKNPLEPHRFAEMAETPAILWGEDGAARVVAFSPHPEMGEFVRRGMALENYVKKYLPIRGEAVMRQTLDFLCDDDSAGFRLIYNAVEWLCPTGAREPAADEDHEGPLLDPALIDSMVRDGLSRIAARASSEGGQIEPLILHLVNKLGTEWDRVAPALRRKKSSVDPSLVFTALARAAEDAAGSVVEHRSLAEDYVLTELLVRICSTAVRCLDADAAINEVLYA